MIYTIGRKCDYDLALLSADLVGTPFIKNGSSEGYVGGIVFETQKAAHNFLVDMGHIADYRTYGVLADWNKDTTLAANKSFRRLVENSPIVRLPQMNGG